MDDHIEVREFLRTRRDPLTPERAGLVGAGPRRASGLRVPASATDAAEAAPTEAAPAEPR